jgi:hypothetical protein
LDALSDQRGQSRSELVRTLVEEGLRMADHPGIIFRPGPVGRRPGLVMGPDVWEVMSVFRRIDATGDQALEETAELTGLSVDQVRTAFRYYAEYTDEIDAWIARNDELAEQAEAQWLREQALLRR